MNETTDRAGKVFRYDDVQHYGFINVRYNGSWVYLPPEEANGKGLENDVEVTFDIRMNGSTPYAVNVKRT